MRASWPCGRPALATLAQPPLPLYQEAASTTRAQGGAGPGLRLTLTQQAPPRSSVGSPVASTMTTSSSTRDSGEELKSLSRPASDSVLLSSLMRITPAPSSASLGTLVPRPRGRPAAQELGSRSARLWGRKGRHGWDGGRRGHGRALWAEPVCVPTALPLPQALLLWSEEALAGALST